MPPQYSELLFNWEEIFTRIVSVASGNNDWFLPLSIYFQALTEIRCVITLKRSGKYSIVKGGKKTKWGPNLSDFITGIQHWFSPSSQSFHFTINFQKIQTVTWQRDCTLQGRACTQPVVCLFKQLIKSCWHTICPRFYGSLIHSETESKGAWLRQGWSSSNVIKSHPLSSCIFLVGQQFQVGESEGCSWSTRMDYLTSCCCHTLPYG